MDKDIVLHYLIEFAIGVAAHLHADAVSEGRIRAARNKLSRDSQRAKVVTRGEPLIDRLQDVAVEVAKLKYGPDITSTEKPLYDLLLDEEFQSQLAEWLMIGGLDEGESAKEKIATRMVQVLRRGMATEDEIARFKAQYFDLIETVIYNNPIISNWRQTAILRDLQQQSRKLVELAQQHAGQYTEEQRAKAVNQYRDLLLKSCDIIDLAQLPEGDTKTVFTDIALRQLYIPLRLVVEAKAGTAPSDADLKALETKREVSRFQANEYATLSYKEDINTYSIGQRLASNNRMVILVQLHDRIDSFM